jgi:hypothetical protein
MSYLSLDRSRINFPGIDRSSEADNEIILRAKERLKMVLNEGSEADIKSETGGL